VFCHVPLLLLKIKSHQRASAVSGAVGEANFEKQLATIHGYDSSPVWRQAFLKAQAAVQETRQIIQSTLNDLGIPREFAPSVSISWYGRGENACKERRAELTRVAATHIAAQTRRAKQQIEAASVEVQTRILAGALESDDARAFLVAMPSPTDLMPLLTENEVRQISADASLDSDTDDDD
jgi:hypothetical protein